MKLVILAIAILCGVVWGEKTRYDGYKLLNVFPESQEQADLIAQFELNEDVINNNTKSLLFCSKIFLSLKNKKF